MKRVKVPRYFAGKRPAYANEEDEEEYITDDEEEPNEDQDQNSDESLDEEQEDEAKEREPEVKKRAEPTKPEEPDEEEEDEDDDPRFRRLKQIEAKTISSDLINVQRTQLIQSKYELSKRNIILDEEDDEDEIRKRHATARQRTLEEPLGPQAVLGNLICDKQQESEDEDEELAKQTRRLDTDDILKDFKLTGISRPTREKQKTEAEEEAEQRRLKAMLEEAKQEATLTLQTYKKVDEDIRKELEREALAKGDIGAREMSSVVTDDDDEELAYEEWKFREIKRVQRDRAARALLLTKVR